MTDRPSPFGILGRALGTGPLGGLKRYLRWFNLTMLQQALWPLLIAVASAPQVDLERTPTGWFLLRLAGPLLAVVVALLYLRQRSLAYTATSFFQESVIPSEAEGSLVHHPQSDTQDVPPEKGERDSSTPLRSGRNDENAGPARNDVRALLSALVTPPASFRFPAIATQLRYALFALPVVIMFLRLLAGPVDEVAQIIVFGLVNVAAYHLVHFGVVPRSFEYDRQGLLAGAILFGLSWGFHNALMFGLSDGGWLPGLAAGLVLGWVFGFGALAL